ncbi:MAG: VanZ family protein [Bacteroidaceae bacterium]|nr:VanZ family protein [Bacteroidales bacterium]MBQ7552748.1 VanZ family protein [Bacteroidaceae bacterium]
MKSFISRYPCSLAIILLVTYLSFFKPPHTQMDSVIGIDKLVHTAMYFLMAGLLWWEFLRGRVKTQAPMWHAWIGAFLCPLLYGGIVELAQEYCTDHRGGEWLDFAANSSGVILAAIAARYLFPSQLKKFGQGK